jgi:prephenate dehydratase
MKKNLTVTIQGGIASFHDLAARQYFHDRTITPVTCKTFRQVVLAVEQGTVDYGIMAIENSLVGSILPNYSLLQQFPVSIVGEFYLPIHHQLLALPGQHLKDLRIVRSHPMALQQCSDFLESQPQLQQVEWEDTAESAREIAEKNESGIAAIASELAAKIYHLEILAANIENLAINYTRFFILVQQSKQGSPTGNKASVIFQLRHEVGALARALQVFKENRLNLTLIQSVPIPGKPTEYRFQVDIEWQDNSDFQKAVAQSKGKMLEFQILGVYQKAHLPF